MDHSTQRALRECADRLIQTADMIARGGSPRTTPQSAASGTIQHSTATLNVPAATSGVTVSPSAALTNSTTNSTANSTMTTLATTARAEHQRLFGYQPPTGSRVSRHARQRNPPRVYLQRPGQTWSRSFVCLASCTSNQLPTPTERISLALSNLGEKKLEFPKNGTGTQVHNCIVNKFPELGQRGYAILRTNNEGGRGKDLMKLPMPASGFSVEYLKNVLGQAKGYLRPLQGDIPLDDEQKVSIDDGRKFY